MPTEHAQARRFARCLNLRLPHRLKPLPGAPRTIFFSLASLLVEELTGLLKTRFRRRHKSIIAWIFRDRNSGLEEGHLDHPNSAASTFSGVSSSWSDEGIRAPRQRGIYGWVPVLK